MEFKLLKECVKLYDSLHQTPKYIEKGFSMVRVKDLKEGFLDIKNPVFVSEEDYLKFTKKYKPQKGDIIFSRVGSYGISSYINFEKNFCLGQNTVLIHPIDIDNKYLYYLFTSPIIKRQIEEKVTGSTQKTISLKSINEFSIPIPTLKHQRKIGETLFNIDLKIETNKKLISLLEDISQNLFKHWFIDFEFPNEEGKPYKSSGGEMVESELEKIPLTWKIGKIDDIAIQKKAKINLDTSLEEFNYIGLEHMPQGNIGLNNWESSNKVSGNKSLFENGDILFGKLRPYFKKVGIAPVPGICSTDILVINSKIDYYKSYLFLQLIQDSFIKYTSNTATGTRMPRTSWKLISNYEIILPNKEVIIKFDEIISPILEKVNHLIHENNNLQQLRDTLLPKLLSGEIEIPDNLEV